MDTNLLLAKDDENLTNSLILPVGNMFIGVTYFCPFQHIKKMFVIFFSSISIKLPLQGVPR